MTFQQLVQRTMLFINRFPPGLAFNQWLYRVTTRVVVRYMDHPMILAFYLRGSVGRGNSVPGMSDIDMNIMIQSADDKSRISFLETISKRFRFVRRFIPVMSLYIHSLDDIQIAEKAGWLYHLSPNEDWVLYKGRHVVEFPPTTASQLVLGWLKLSYRRFLGLQKRHFNRDPERAKLGFFKINTNLLLYMARLLFFLKNGNVPPATRSIQELADDVDNTSLKMLVTYSHEQYFRHKFFLDPRDYYRDVMPGWFGTLQAASQHLNPSFIAGTTNWGEYRLTSEKAAPESLSYVRPLFDSFFAELKEKACHYRFALAFSSVPHRNYNFKIYLVVRDDMALSDVQAFDRFIHQTYWPHINELPNEYFVSFPGPLIVTESMYKQMALSEKGGLEPYYMRQHGDVVFNELGHPLPEMDTTASIRSFLSESMSHVRFVRVRRDFLPYREEKFKSTFIDYVTGVLPAMRILLEKKIIVTTPKEALREYSAHFDDGYRGFLGGFYRQYAGASLKEIDYRELIELYRKNFSLLREQSDVISRLYREFFKNVSF